MRRIPRLLYAQIFVVVIFSVLSSEDASGACDEFDDSECVRADALSLLQVGAKFQVASNSQTGSVAMSKSLQGNAPDDAMPQTLWDCCGDAPQIATRNLYFFCEGPLVRPNPETRSYTTNGVALTVKLMCGTSLDALTNPMKYMFLKLPDALNYCEDDKMAVSLMVTLPASMKDHDFFTSEVWYNTPMVPECSFKKLSMLQTDVIQESGVTNPGAAFSLKDALLQVAPSGFALPGSGVQMIQEEHVRTLTFFCQGPVVRSTPETLTHESFGPAPLGRFMCGTSMDSLTHPMTYLFVQLPGGFDCELGTMVMKAMVTLPADETDHEFFAVSRAWRKMALIPRCMFYDFTQGTVSFATHGVFNPGTRL